MTKTVAVINQKGGSAKTTTTLNLAACLAKNGLKVLIVDADPQSSLSIYVGEDIFSEKASLSDVLIEDYDIRDTIIKYRENLDVVPADLHLAKVELSLLGELSREYKLERALATVRDNYDFVFIDCPPSLAMMTVNSLTAADYVLIPSSCDYLSMWGVQILYTTILAIKKNVNKKLNILGLVRTLYDARTNNAKQALAKTEELYANHMRVFKTVIRSNTQLKESVVEHKPIFEHAPKSTGAEDYYNLYVEFMEAIHEQEKREST